MTDIDIHTQSHTPSPDSSRPHLLLVHGSWGGGWMWQKYVPYLTKKGWNVDTLDLRGHGKSGGSVAGATMEDYERDVAQAIEKLGLSSPAVVGHSMGGLVALMYARDHDVSACVAIDPSPSQEVQGESVDKQYKEEYTPMDAGMPKEPQAAMRALPDVPQEVLLNVRKMLGTESGVARSERKKGISVPKDSLARPTLFVGGELGESLPFGIGIETARKMADYYESDVVEVKGATHPGILVGEHAQEAVEKVEEWLSEHV